MKKNIMVIGNREAEPVNKALNIDQSTPRERIDEPVVQRPVYEKYWGNESTIMNRLEGKLLEDRRLYARALYMQKAECNTLYESLIRNLYHLRIRCN